MRYIDISQTISNGMKKYPSDPDVKISQFKSLRNGDSCNLLKLTFGSHVGTHIDVPHHIYGNGKGVTDIRINDLICDAIVTNIKGFPEKGLFKKIKFKGIKGILFKDKEHRGGLTIKEAKRLVKNNIKVIGTEQMSVEESFDKSHSVHRLLLSNGSIIIEGLDLKKARPGYYKLICLPLKIKNGDGAPVRAILVDD